MVYKPLNNSKTTPKEVERLNSLRDQGLVYSATTAARLTMNGLRFKLLSVNEGNEGSVFWSFVPDEEFHGLLAEIDGDRTSELFIFIKTLNRIKRELKVYQALKRQEKENEQRVDKVL